MIKLADLVLRLIAFLLWSLVSLNTYNCICDRIDEEEIDDTSAPEAILVLLISIGAFVIYTM